MVAFIFACDEGQRCWLFQLVRLGDGLPKQVWTMGVDGAGHICVYISDFPVWSFEESSSSSTLPNSDIPFIRLFIHSFIHICSTTFSLSSHSTSQFRETCLSQIPTCSHPFLPSSLWPHLRQPTPPQTLRHPPQSPMPPASRPKSPLSLSRSPSPSKP